MVDLKKEIKLSDLFKRRERETEPQPVAPSAPTEEASRKAAQAAPQIPLMRAFNLMPKEVVREREGRRGATAQIALAVVAVLLFGAAGSLFLLSSSAVTSKTAKRDELRSKLASLNVTAKPPGDPRAPALVTERQSRTTELATALQSRIAWDRLLRDFALVLPEDVWLTTLVAKGAPRDPAAAAGAAPAAGATASSFTITGYTHEQDDVARLLARLAVLPELANVALVSSARVEVNDQEVVQFQIAAGVKHGGGAAT